MAGLTRLRWHADAHALTQALAGARSVQTVADPHISPLLPPRVVQRQPLALFGDVRRHCTSFSAWWKHTTHGVTAAERPARPGGLDGHPRGRAATMTRLLQRLFTPMSTDPSALKNVSRYTGRRVALLTQHGKEQVLKTVMEPALGCVIEHVSGYDTDLLGTFTREAPRPGAQIDALRLKTRKGMELSGLALGMASEGSFAPRPLHRHVHLERGAADVDR